MAKRNVVGETMERAVMIATCRGLADVCRELAKEAKDKDTGKHFECLGSSFDNMGRIHLGALSKEMEPKKRKPREKRPVDKEVLNILKGSRKR